VTPRGDGGLHVTGDSILSPLRNHQLILPKLSSTPQAGWDRMDWDEMRWGGCFPRASVMTQVENMSVIPVAQLNA